MKVLKTLMEQSGVGFGTSGARGLVTEMTDEVCAGYTEAFVRTMQTRFRFNRVAIAVDLRPSSGRIAEACAKMLRQLEMDVVFCGAIPTPALALYSQAEAIPGIMVTGSHIPFDRNGLKFYRPDGEITKADESAMLASSLTVLSEQRKSLPLVNAAAQETYINRYVALLGSNALSGIKLAIYQHSSVGRDLMQRLLVDLGAEVICLARSDTFVPIDTEAVSQIDNERGLAWANQYQVDAIISTDGDGDRPLISDENGKWLRGDIVGLLTAKALGVTHLVVPVSCNTAIEATGFFEKVVRTRIGSPFVIAGMEEFSSSETARVAGFEANGGFLLGSSLSEIVKLPTRDALLPVVILLSQIKTNGVPLSRLVDSLPQRFTSSDRLQNFPTERSKSLLAIWSKNMTTLQKELQLESDIAKTDETDGLRLTLKSGQIVHLRPSGNAPEFRCYVEDNTQYKAQRLLESVMLRLRLFNELS